MNRTPHLAIIGVASGLALVLALLACTGGFLFSGLSSCFVVFFTVPICWVATSVVAWVRRRRCLDFGWHRCLALVLIMVVAVFGALCWMDRRDHLGILMEPAPVPAGLQVHQGQSRLFGMYVHFSGSPEAIASLLKAKGLVEVPTEPTESSDGYGSRERSKAAWDWWQPANLSQPRFFFRHHKSEAIQGWSEGWWINGATNEVYAFLSG